VAKPGIVLVKRFNYRGQNEEWSNKYHFTESPPANPTDWRTLIDALANKEKTVYSAGTHIVRAYGYSDTDNDAVFSVDYTALAEEIAGTFNEVGMSHAAGDAAVWVRWLTPDHNSRGKPIYLRKYFHGAEAEATDHDQIAVDQKAALLAFGTALAGGTGAITGFTICGPTGAVAGAVGASSWITTRTLKRRGRRP
jgi:hypothetical protein